MTRHELPPAVRQLIDEVPHGVPEHLSPSEQRDYLRAISDVVFLRYGLPGPDVHSVTEHAVPVAGGQITLRAYRPSGRVPLPGHLTLHGGGWKAGSIFGRESDAICRQRCVEADCVVLALEYRLAPEHRFPVPVDDCYAALLWVAANADLLGLDAENLSIGGASAGANLAAAVTLRCRDEGGPRLRLQLLEVPALDLTRETARATLAAGLLPDVPQPTMDDATSSYLTDPLQARDPLASPLLAPEVRDLPAAHVMTAEYDVLRADGEQYAQRLSAAGVPVTHVRYPRALHGTAMLTRTWDEARRWQRDAAAVLRQAHWTAAGSNPAAAAARS